MKFFSFFCGITALFILALSAFGWASEASKQQFVNKKFGFEIELPHGPEWELEKEDVQDSITVGVQREKSFGAITVIAVDMAGVYPVQEFAAFMCEELENEMRFLKVAEKKKIPRPFGKQGHSDMVFREYTGRNDYTLIGFRVKGEIGYAVVGIYGRADRPTENIIRGAMKSFRLTPGD